MLSVVSQKMWERRLKRHHNAFLFNPYLPAIHDHLDVQKHIWFVRSAYFYFVWFICPTGDRTLVGPRRRLEIIRGLEFNFGNAAVTFDTAHLHSSYFHRPSMYSPKLCRTRSQR